MRLKEQQVSAFQESGFLLLSNLYSTAEVAVLKAELLKVFAEDTPKRVLEKDRGAVRSVYGSHMTNEVFGYLSRHPRIVRPVQQLLGNDVYVYQFKINAKAAFDGDVWEWHQDYVFWKREDGMATDRVVSAAIFLDDANEFNGPILLIPGSHAEGVINYLTRSPESVTRESVYQNSPDWISNLTADLKYSLDMNTVACLVKRHGLVAAKGPAGSVLFFHGSIVHASSNNISPFDRTVVIVTFNSMHNVPLSGESRRPDFLVNQYPTAVVTERDDVLLSCAHFARTPIA